MPRFVFVPPDGALLARYGFEPSCGIPGFFQSNYINGILTTLVMQIADRPGHIWNVSIREFPEDDEDGENYITRIDRLPVDSDAELYLLLGKVFN